MSAPDPGARAELVKMARELERALLRRRKKVRELADLEGRIRELRKFLGDLVAGDTEARS